MSPLILSILLLRALMSSGLKSEWDDWHLIAYLEANRVLELPPSVDHKDSDEVEADIDHFSRYAIAY